MGAVFCDDPTPHDGHLMLDVDAIHRRPLVPSARCPGRGLQETPATVCATCGREQDQEPRDDCEAPDWHGTPAAEIHSASLVAVGAVARTLHATYCACDGYSTRDLQVALDATVAVRS